MGSQIVPKSHFTSSALIGDISKAKCFIASVHSDKTKELRLILAFKCPLLIFCVLSDAGPKDISSDSLFSSPFRLGLFLVNSHSYL